MSASPEIRLRGPGLGAVLGALFLAVVTFVYRFNALGGALGGFGNDQFIQLARARQLLAGDLPYRDFVEPGAPLISGASALAQVASGHTLLGEAWLSIGALAVGVAITVWLAARLTGRVWPALLVGVLQIAISPRLYNYPKILFTAAGIWLCWRYVDRPAASRILALAACVTLAFLFRHDFLVYIGALALLTIALANRGRPKTAARHAIALGALALLFVSPYLIHVQRSGGLGEYVRQSASFAEADAERTSFHWPRPDTPFALPLVWLAPPDAPPPARINVQWAATLSPAERIAREQRYGLEDGEYRDGTTWNYRATRTSSETIEALVRDPVVRDTHGIDRVTFTLGDARPPTGWRAAVDRIRLAPALTSRANAVAFLYYTLAALPGLAALAWLTRARSRAYDPGRLRQAVPYLWPVIGLSALLAAGFLSRGTTNARLADVAVPMGLLAAWLLCAHRERTGMRTFRAGSFAVRLSGILLLVISAWSIGIAGAVPAAMTQTKIFSFAGAADRAATVWETLSRPPLGTITADGTVPPLAVASGYVHRCTPADARIFVFGSLPELYFFSGRLYAGGHSWILPGYATTPAEQQLTIERLRAHDVPLVLTEPEPVFSKEYVPDFPLVVDYLASRYTDVGALPIGDTATLRVRLLKDATWRARDRATGLPCAPPASGS